MYLSLDIEHIASLISSVYEAVKFYEYLFCENKFISLHNVNILISYPEENI